LGELVRAQGEVEWRRTVVVLSSDEEALTYGMGARI
jgi:hypothetical protein